MRGPGRPVTEWTSYDFAVMLEILLVPAAAMSRTRKQVTITREDGEVRTFRKLNPYNAGTAGAWYDEGRKKL